MKRTGDGGMAGKEDQGQKNWRQWRGKKVELDKGKKICFRIYLTNGNEGFAFEKSKNIYRRVNY